MPTFMATTNIPATTNPVGPAMSLPANNSNAVSDASKIIVLN
jgi:hypothetical protein